MSVDEGSFTRPRDQARSHSVSNLTALYGGVVVGEHTRLVNRVSEEINETEESDQVSGTTNIKNEVSPELRDTRFLEDNFRLLVICMGIVQGAYAAGVALVTSLIGDQIGDYSLFVSYGFVAVTALFLPQIGYRFFAPKAVIVFIAAAYTFYMVCYFIAIMLEDSNEVGTVFQWIILLAGSVVGGIAQGIFVPIFAIYGAKFSRLIKLSKYNEDNSMDFDAILLRYQGLFSVIFLTLEGASKLLATLFTELMSTYYGSIGFTLVFIVACSIGTFVSYYYIHDLDFKPDVEARSWCSSETWALAFETPNLFLKDRRLRYMLTFQCMEGYIFAFMIAYYYPYCVEISTPGVNGVGFFAAVILFSAGLSSYIYRYINKMYPVDGPIWVIHGSSISNIALTIWFMNVSNYEFGTWIQGTIFASLCGAVIGAIFSTYLAVVTNFFQAKDINSVPSAQGVIMGVFGAASSLSFLVIDYSSKTGIGITIMCLAIIALQSVSIAIYLDRNEGKDEYDYYLETMMKVKKMLS